MGDQEAVEHLGVTIVAALQKKRTEDELRRSEAEYRRIVETANEGIWLIDEQANTAFVNPRMANMLGYTIEEMLGEPLMSFIDEDAKAQAHRYLERRRQGIVEQHDFRFLRKDGTAFSAYATIFVFDDVEHGKVAINVLADISDRKQAELALQKAHSEFEKRVEERTGHLSEANKRLQREIRQRKEAEKELEEHRENLEELVEARTSGLAAVNWQLRVEINERERIAETLRDAKNYTDNIIRSMGDMLVVVSPDGKIVTVNEAACELLGYSEGELVGKSARILFEEEEEEEEEEEDTAHPILSQDSLPFKRTVLARLIRKGAFRNVEKSVLTKNAAKIPVLLSGSVIRDGDGGILGIVCLALDITERRRAEEALVRSERQLAAAYDAVPVRMLLLDENRRVRRANRAAIDASILFGCGELVGLCGGEALGCTYAVNGGEGCDCYPACRTCGIRTMMHDTLETGNSHYRQAQKLVIQRDGAEAQVYVLVSSFGVSLEGRPYLLLSVEDVTEHREAERQLRQREAELAHVSRIHMVGIMAATLAHELNQPLYAIKNYVRGIQRRLKNENAAPGVDHLVEAIEQVVKEVDRAAGIVTHLREFVRGRKPHRSSVDIRRLLYQAVDLLEPLARDKGVGLELEASKDFPIVQADPIQIEQVVVNLVTNAIDAVSSVPAKRQRVTITGRLAETGVTEVVVRDCGPGIAKDLGDKLFEAFATTKEDGLGLGLAISRSIVESHGGKIWMVDNEPHGAAFHFTVPSNTAVKE